MAKVILCQSDLFNFIWSLETSDIPLATSTFLSFLKKKNKTKTLIYFRYPVTNLSVVGKIVGIKVSSSQDKLYWHL